MVKYKMYFIELFLYIFLIKTLFKIYNKIFDTLKEGRCEE